MHRPLGSHCLPCKTSGGPVKEAHAHCQHRCASVKTLLTVPTLQPAPSPQDQILPSLCREFYGNERSDFDWLKVLGLFVGADF